MVNAGSKAKNQIYFDNASTSFPKPEEVYKALDNYARKAVNPGRGTYRQSVNCAQDIFEARCAIANYLGLDNPERLAFTSGCTDSLNKSILGINWQAGDVVLHSALEHNAVMRPLRRLEKKIGIKLEALLYRRGKIVDIDYLKRRLKSAKPRLVVLCAASNVTGEVLDSRVYQLLADSGVDVIIDAAQSAGHVRPMIYSRTLWCASGHKGLLGFPGVGLLYVAKDAELEPIFCGGTGSKSEDLEMPDFFPDRLESGTLPGPSIASLKAGVDWLSARKPKELAAHDLKLSLLFLNWLSQQNKLELVGVNQEDLKDMLRQAENDPSSFTRLPIYLVNAKGMSAALLADRLDSHYNIAVRHGLQCAMLAHKNLGTLESGAVRISFGPLNTEDEVEFLCQSLERICA